MKLDVFMEPWSDYASYNLVPVPTQVIRILITVVTNL